MLIFEYLSELVYAKRRETMGTAAVAGTIVGNLW